MALSITADLSTITVLGWTDSVAFTRAPAGSTSTVLTVGSKFTIKANEFASYVGSSGTGYVVSINSYTSSSGTDKLGTYLELNLSCTVSLVSTATEVYRFRFYDGVEVFDVRVTTAGSWFGFTRRILALTQTASEWFTVGHPRSWGVRDSDNGTTLYGDYNSSSWRSSYLNQMVLPSSPSRHHIGLPFVSETNGGIGAYVAFGSNLSYPSVFEFTTAATKLTTRMNSSTGGFFVTTGHGYPALRNYALWQQRDDLWASTDNPNAVRPMFPSAKGNPVTGGPVDTNYTTADILAWVGVCASAYPAVVGPTACMRTVECDSAWYSDSSYTPKAQCADVASSLQALGYEAWCYVTPTMSSASAAAANIHAMGFTGCRYDGVYGEPYTEAATLMAFRTAIKTLNPDFHIETHHSYLQALCDTLRTNDWPYAGTVDGFTTGWDTALIQRAAMSAWSSPNKVLDCDLLGNNAAATDTSRSLANALKQARIMFGFGRPILGWMGPTPWNGDDVFADPTLVRYFTRYEFIVNRSSADPIPTHTITGQVGGAYTSVQTFSDGSTISYDSQTDVLTFDIPVTATADSDSINLSWEAV